MRYRAMKTSTEIEVLSAEDYEKLISKRNKSVPCVFIQVVKRFKGKGNVRVCEDLPF